MPRLSLRRYDVQARIALVAAIAAAVLVLALAVLVFRRVDWTNKVIAYRPNTLRWYLIMLVTGMSILVSALALGFGLNSAGQRRNDRHRWSWIGFFLGAACLCLTILLFVVFRLWGDVPLVAV